MSALTTPDPPHLLLTGCSKALDFSYEPLMGHATGPCQELQGWAGRERGAMAVQVTRSEWPVLEPSTKLPGCNLPMKRMDVSLLCEIRPMPR